MATFLPSGTIVPGHKPTAWATETDWARHKEHIQDLYLYRKNTLAEVMRIMEDEHGFKSSENVYKKHIKKWGIDKKNKKFEMRAMARKYSEREQKGKKSHFTVRGRAVDLAEILRYCQRRDESIDDLLAQRAASKTPEAVKCYTPLGSPIRTPEVLALPEQIFITVRDYHKGCFEAGIWVGDDGKSCCRSTKAQFDSEPPIKKFRDQCSLAIGLFFDSRWEEAGVVLRAATGGIKEIVREEHPDTLIDLCITISIFWAAAGRPEVSLAILRQFSAMAQLKLGESHPLRLICGWFASTSELDFEDIVLQSCQILCEVFTSVLGPFHRSSIDHQLKMARLDSYFALSPQETSHQALLRECEDILGLYDPRTSYVRLELARSNLIQGNFGGARKMAEVVITSDAPDKLRILGLDYLAGAQYGLGETQEAETSLRAAIEWGRSCWGNDDGEVQRWMLKLERWLVTRGDFEGAAQVHRERLVIWESTIIPASEQ
ncbi:hypothetical protein G7Y79_00071g097210 [Physcia stellaris]|nr:hypothetical protein G7Y79_00071g097210 [Physcia stellaris]